MLKKFFFVLTLLFYPLPSWAADGEGAFAYSASDYDYQLKLDNPYQLIQSSESSSAGTPMEAVVTTLDIYVDIDHSTPDSGTTYSGTKSCDSGWAVSKIKIQKTVWKTFTKGISYMELYCSPYQADGSLDTSQEVKDSSFGYDTGDSLESVSCNGLPIAGLMNDGIGYDDHLGVVCQDAYIKESDHSAVAGLSTSAYDGTSGYGYNHDYYSLTFEVDKAGEVWTESETQDYSASTDATWCIKGLSGDTFSSAGAVTGLDYQYQRSRDSDCVTCNDNALVFDLHAYCYEAVVDSIPPECGDGQKQGTEECDDGDSDNLDSCTNDCKNAKCGDEYTQSYGKDGEECDDGNSSNTDSCTTDCKEARCGDGMVNRSSSSTGGSVGPEQNRDPTFFKGQGFTGPTPSAPEQNRDSPIFKGQVPEPAAPEQTNRPSTTIMDQRNFKVPSPLALLSASISTTFAASQSQPPTGSSNVSQTTVYSLDGLEECDDGNNANNDGCSSTCEIESCGDGTRQTSEACDDGNTTNGDGCSATCTEEPGPGCGDGQINQTTETCDDGNTTDNDGCSSACRIESCGDGVRQTSEACDDGNTTAGDGCSVGCIDEHLCGDGVVDIGEACDFGSLNSDSSADACRTSCVKAACGDKVVDSDEQCDDGNTTAGDGCNASCKNETIAVCGDGILQSGEDCDKGSANSDSQADACRTDCQNPSCGDGVKDSASGEACDDGNHIDGDGCSSTCAEEAGAAVTSQSPTPTADECTSSGGTVAQTSLTGTVISLSEWAAFRNLSEGDFMTVGGISVTLKEGKYTTSDGEVLVVEEASDGYIKILGQCVTAEGGGQFVGSGCKCNMTPNDSSSWSRIHLLLLGLFLIPLFVCLSLRHRQSF